MNGLVPAGREQVEAADWQSVSAFESDDEEKEEEIVMRQKSYVPEKLLHASHSNSPGATLLLSFGPHLAEKGRYLLPARGSTAPRMQDLGSTAPSAEVPAIPVSHCEKHHAEDVRRLLCLEITESQLSAEVEAESLRLRCQELADEISKAEMRGHTVAAEPFRPLRQTDLCLQLRELSQEVEQLQRIPLSPENLRRGKEGKRAPLLWFPAPRLVHPL